MSKSNQYVGLDVSLKETSFCVIDDAGKIVWRGRVDSTAGSYSNGREAACAHAVRIGSKVDSYRARRSMS
jgi:transposase